jgi:hypothetical protein
MPNSAQPKSWRDVLPVHPAADLFPGMSESELRELGKDIKKNGLRSPIVLWAPGSNTDKEPSYRLLDGRSRLDAMELVGIKTVDQGGLLKELGGLRNAVHRCSEFHTVIEVVFGRSAPKEYREPGTDPYAFVLSANIHRRHLTAEQKRELIAKLIKETPNKSDRQIANQTNVDHKTVGKTRSKLEATGEIPQLEKTVGSDGKSRSKSKRSAKPAAPPKSIIELDRGDYSKVPATSAKPTSPARNDPIGGPPVRYSGTSATSVPRLSPTVHFLVNDFACKLKEADGKLSTHDRAALFAKIRALVDADDIVGETLRLIEKMTPAQRQDFVACLKTKGLISAFVPQGSAEIPIEQRKAEHAALDGIPNDLSIPRCLRRVAP